MTKLKTIVGFLDRELRIDEFKDSSNNGLQVENSGKIKKVCCGVDASMEFFEAAASKGADLLICHHGMSWGDSLAHITDLNYKRIKFLMEHDMALYASHLPLDAHARYGNNAGIAKALGLGKLKPFGMYNGSYIGFEGCLSKPMGYAAFKKKVSGAMGGAKLHTKDFGKKKVQTVAIVSGGAAGEVAEAGQKGIDVYLSGEPALVAYSLAQEYGINAIFASHYTTEVFGVRALGDLLQKKFAVKAEFLNFNIPF
ncbi:MAG: Nif3-like dinuclear metal center hexameric protein [Kiritimatiellae bacterium]|nr:Nif3-like dinuclear metal center hexameric protein [Kiritimatiellia bacterium]